MLHKGAAHKLCSLGGGRGVVLKTRSELQTSQFPLRFCDLKHINILQKQAHITHEAKPLGIRFETIWNDLKLYVKK